MKLNAVVIADDVAENIGELCVMLKNSTNQLLKQFEQARNGSVEVNCFIYCHDTINKHNLSEKVSLVNTNTFFCCWYGHGSDTSFSMNSYIFLLPSYIQSPFHRTYPKRAVGFHIHGINRIR